MAAERGELGRQLPLRGPLKALEADIHHANAMADAIQRNYGGACVQMRLSFSSLAPFFLYFIQWLDCGCCYALPSYLGLFHILICKVYADGDSSVSTYERRASLREFYAIIYPILQQLESSLIERDMKGKGRCKDIVSRRRMEDWKRLSGKDVEREDECGICMETCTKMVLPNCSHAMCIKCYRDWYKRSESCPFCRGSLKRIRSRDLWVLTNYNDVIDSANLERENYLRKAYARNVATAFFSNKDKDHKWSVFGTLLAAMFPEQGTGTWDVERCFEKLCNERAVPLQYVPIRDGTHSKYDWNDVPGTWNMF